MLSLEIFENRLSLTIHQVMLSIILSLAIID